MDTDEDFLFRMNVALGQRQVDLVRGQVGVGVQGEFAVRRLNVIGEGAFNQSLVMTAEVDQVGDGAYLQTVFLGEDD